MFMLGTENAVGERGSLAVYAILFYNIITAAHCDITMAWSGSSMWDI